MTRKEPLPRYALWDSVTANMVGEGTVLEVAAMLTEMNDPNILVIEAEASRPPVSGDALREALDRWYDQEHPGLDENEWRDGLAAYLSDVIALAATPPERSGLDAEHRPAIGLSSAGRHTLCLADGEPWPCRLSSGGEG